MKNTLILYQHGTLALLVPGLLRGTMTMGDLLAHGDTGIGTGEGLDGELIILDGVAYQVQASGAVNIVGNDFLLPFGNAHWVDYQPKKTVTNLSKQRVDRQVPKDFSAENTFFSIKITGKFSQVITRAVKKSDPPYQTLAQTADKQQLFHQKDVAGTLLGYYSPTLFDGISVGGFHFHFLSAAHDFGGHVLDFSVAQGQLAIQKFNTLEQHLPTTDPTFMKHSFDHDDIIGSIAKAEK